MRQALSKKRTTILAAELNLPILSVMVRGNTDHRRDLFLEDGSIVMLYKDGTMAASSLRWVNRGGGI